MKVIITITFYMGIHNEIHCHRNLFLKAHGSDEHSWRITVIVNYI